MEVVPKLPNVVFEKRVTEGEPQNLPELLGLDYSKSFPQFYDFLKSMINKYEVQYLSANINSEKQIYGVIFENNMRTFRQVYKFECFSFAWLVLSNLIEQDLLPKGFVAFKPGYVKTINVFIESIEYSH